MTRESTKSKVVRGKFSQSRRSKEAMAAAELVLQPWFLPKPVARAIFDLVPPDYRYRMRDFFIDWGCLRCERKNIPYGSNGMCLGCKMTVYYRLFSTAKRRLKLRQQLHYGREFVAHAEKARKLLVGFSPWGAKPSKLSKVKSVQVGSPAIHALDRFEK